MKHIPIVLLLSLSSLLGQAPNNNTSETPPRERRSRRPPPVISPEVAEDQKVTFRLKAAKADQVLLRGQWSKEPAKMTKGDNDVWSVTVGPVEPGVWEYSFVVDGLAMIDPGNTAIKPMRSPRTSILHLPGSPPLIHDFQEVPHGTVHTHAYRSKSLGSLREVAVYTPPGYAKQADAAFPTMYLQHGSGDNHATWTAHGKAHWILDNLIAQKKAVPMVVVMMNGHAASERGKNTESFERDLLEDVLPFVESRYRVKRDSANRCLVGLSMGGGQSLTIGLNHTDIFGWVGGFSSSAPREELIANALENAEATNDHLKLLWVACGKDDFLLKRNQDFIAMLTEKKVPHQWLLTEGDHSWPIWRRYLSDFAPLLFQ